MMRSQTPAEVDSFTPVKVDFSVIFQHSIFKEEM